MGSAWLEDSGRREFSAGLPLVDHEGDCALAIVGKGITTNRDWLAECMAFWPEGSEAVKDEFWRIVERQGPYWTVETVAFEYREQAA